MKKAFVIAVFAILCLLLLYPPVVCTLEDAGILSGMSAGIAVEEPEPATGFGASILNAFSSFRYRVEMTYRNYLPAYPETVSVYKNALHGIDSPVYSFYDRQTEKTPEPPEKISDGIKSHTCEYLAGSNRNRYYKITLDMDDGSEIEFLEAIAVLTPEQKAERLEEQIQKVNRLVRADKDVNVCVYVAANMEFADFLPTYIPEETSGKDDLDHFLASIDPSAKTGAITFSGVLDRVKRCFLTDHHWSAEGSYIGYCEILDLLRADAPEILPARPFGKSVTVEPCKFYGSYARTLAYSALWDPFVVCDYGLPAFTSTPQFDFDTQVKTLAGMNIDNMNSNAYGEFYPEVYRIIYPENRTGRNLLVIGDSYTQGFCELLASSFDTTSVFYWSNYSTLDYNDYIEKNNITDVLIMLYGPRMLYNATDDYFLERIKVADGGED